jgi:hypothetical protein
MRGLQVSSQLIDGGWIWYIEIAIYQRAAHDGDMWATHAALLPTRYNDIIFCLAKILEDPNTGIVMTRGSSGTEL